MKQAEKRCKNKMVFSTTNEARQYIKEDTARNRNIKKGQLRAYQCHICGLYHLTSQSKQESRRRKRRFEKIIQQNIGEQNGNFKD